MFGLQRSEQTGTRSRETGSTVELGATTGPPRQSLSQDVPLPEQGAQTTRHTARAPRCPWGHDAVHLKRGQERVSKNVSKNIISSVSCMYDRVSYRSPSRLIHPHSPSVGHICGPGEHTPHWHKRTVWWSRGWGPLG